MKKGVSKERKYVVSGERLRQCRKNLGLTQEELAEKISKLPGSSREKCSFKTIGNMERGYNPISAEYADLLAQIFGCNPQWLRGNSEMRTMQDCEQRTKDIAGGLWQANRGKNSDNIGVMVGGYIKRYRALRGMTIATLSERCGISKERIGEYEADASSASTHEIGCICEALEVKTGMLYGELPPPEDLAEWTIYIGDGFVHGHTAFVVNHLISELNSEGVEAALCMLRGLVQNRRYLRKKENERGDIS